MRETLTEERLRDIEDDLLVTERRPMAAEAIACGRESIALLRSVRVALSKGGEHIDVDELRKRIDALLVRAR